jgi:hypothetical protein
MLRLTTRTALLPAALLLSALAACAGGSPTGPGAPMVRHDGTTTPPPPADTVRSKPANYENPGV